MSAFIQTRKRWFLVAAGVAVVLTIVFAAAWKQPATGATQEIVLFAKDSTFRLAASPDEPNPELRLTKGNPVKLIIRNDEPEKVLHCFTISGMDVSTSRDLSTGESESLSFTPDEVGTYAYACLMHPSMIGKIVVR
ncbi:MAG TPA: cupredoxin domain-containing protein [Roseimicrobium sp.]|nr:cupredoxin domain-containing protein [Roseimicrobium sp.]